jgi:predicted nucleic acid-binding Zn ribbon protein
MAPMAPMARPREEESVAVGQPARKKARGEKNDLPERQEIKGAGTLTKINIMKGLWDKKKSWEKPLTSGADTFQKKFLNQSQVISPTPTNSVVLPSSTYAQRQ